MDLTAKITIDFIVDGIKEFYVEILEIPEEVSAGELQEIVDKRAQKVKQIKHAEIVYSSIKINRINQMKH
ncbi:hypothetical protein [Alkalihalobacillus sp. AL-G]|uniref:hypothetical protein n=1 Tax=Alkalihalobacillus sp. AL-G TaxID=2926399 RepID=UPI00272A3A9E|nr:hypothetical protein [Alkalihalobacillus sp. AL-G]WLD94263.1 hypothetical protein MOJ78_05050 [Alkalihalobacillus sp. AL-G]